MPRYMHIENGVAINAIVVEDPQQFPGWTLVRSDAANVGDLWDGEKFTAPAVPYLVPDEVAMSQARIVMLRHGISKADVENAINASALSDEDKAEALIEFEYRTTVRRSSSLVALLAPALNLTDAQVDAMFIAAAA